VRKFFEVWAAARNIKKETEIEDCFLFRNLSYSGSFTRRNRRCIDETDVSQYSVR